MAFEKLLYIYKKQGVRRESGSNLDWYQNPLISHIYTLHCTDCCSSPLICLLIAVGWSQTLLKADTWQTAHCTPISSAWHERRVWGHQSYKSCCCCDPGTFYHDLILLFPCTPNARDRGTAILKNAKDKCGWDKLDISYQKHLPPPSFPFWQNLNSRGALCANACIPRGSWLSHPSPQPQQVSPQSPLCHWHLGRPWPSHTDVPKGSDMWCCCQEDKQQQDSCTALNIWGLSGLLNGPGKSPCWQTSAEQETQSHVLCAPRTHEGLNPAALSETLRSCS